MDEAVIASEAKQSSRWYREFWIASASFRTPRNDANEAAYFS
jgi:hypothetical protein